MNHKHQCPSHTSHIPGDDEPDKWVQWGDDRVCSYCGSLHPEEFINFLKDAIDPTKPRHYLGETTKGHKVYIHRPNVSNASEGAIKFYGWHTPSPLSAEDAALFREAQEVSFRKMMAVLDQASIELFT